MTLSKLAKLANISVSTASKAFSMSNEVNDETRQMIFDLAKRHGCFKKFFNAKYPKTVVAIICPETKSRYYSEILDILQYEFESKNCEMCIVSTRFSEEKQLELLKYYDNYSTVDGIVLLNGIQQNFNEFEIPIVSVLGKTIDDINHPFVKINYKDAIYEAVEYFAKNNITDIGFIGELHTRQKQDLFVSALYKQFGNADPRLISISEKRFEAGGYEAMEKFYKKNILPRALICAYDYIAIGAIRCINDHGGKVPEDIAVIGMDNIPETSFLNPRLSSVGIPINYICKAVGDKLFSLIMNEPYEMQSSFNAELILRESSEMR